MANNYQALLSAAISPQGIKNIESQIKAISKKYKLNIEINTDNSTLQKYTKKLQEQIKKSKTQLVIEDNTGITQVEDKRARAYSERWNKAEKARADNAIKQQQRVVDFIDRQSNALRQKVAGKESLLDYVNKDTGIKLRDEFNSIMKDLQNMSSDGGKSIGEMSSRIDGFNTKLKETGVHFKNTNHDGYNFAEMISLAAKKIAIWAISTGLIYGTLRQIKAGVQYVIDLDNAMNEVRIVTGMTKDQVNDLAKSYNQLAKDLKTTTAELTQVSVELYRQGLSGSELDDRLQAIVKYAKISKISLQDSEKIITATANATGRSVQNIIDIFSQLGDTTALNYPSAA